MHKINTSAFKSWLMLLLCFGLDLYLTKTPELRAAASFITPGIKMAIYLITLVAAAFILDWKPRLRNSALRAALTVIFISTAGIVLSKGIFLDFCIVLWYMGFAPAFLICLFNMRKEIKRRFFTAFNLLTLTGYINVILLRHYHANKTVTSIVLFISLAILFILSRSYKNEDQDVYRFNDQLSFIKKWKWIIPFALIHVFMNIQITNIYIYKLLPMRSELFHSISSVYSAAVVVAVGLLLDKKGGMFVNNICTVLASIGLIVMLLPADPSMNYMYIPLYDIGESGYAVIFYLFPFIVLPSAKGYRHYSAGLIIYTFLGSLPQLIPDNLLETNMGRVIVGITVINSLVIMYLLLRKEYEHKKKQMEGKWKTTHELVSRSNLPDLTGYALTPREAQVASLLLQAKSRDQVGVELGLSRGTINTYCTSLFKKVGCSSQAELISRLTVMEQGRGNTYLPH